MRDETLVEPFAVQEFFVDGFADHKIINGIFHCAGYRFQEPSRANGDPLKVIVVRFVMPADALQDAINRCYEAQKQPFWKTFGRGLQTITS